MAPHRTTDMPNSCVWANSILKPFADASGHVTSKIPEVTLKSGMNPPIISTGQVPQHCSHQGNGTGSHGNGAGSHGNSTGSHSDVACGHGSAGSCSSYDTGLLDEAILVVSKSSSCQTGSSSVPHGTEPAYSELDSDQEAQPMEEADSDYDSDFASHRRYLQERRGKRRRQRESAGASLPPAKRNCRWRSKSGQLRSVHRQMLFQRRHRSTRERLRRQRQGRRKEWRRNRKLRRRRRRGRGGGAGGRSTGAPPRGGGQQGPASALQRPRPARFSWKSQRNRR